MRKTPLLFLICCLAAAGGNAQSLAEKAVQQLDSFATLYPQEKVFVHLDRGRYITGETIWFQAYAMLDGKPTYLSKVLYAELVNGEGKVVEKRMLPLKNGTASGEILLRKELPSGAYALNAYTLWMLNFPKYVFTRTVQVYNTDARNPAIAKKPNTLDIQFFPEGGNLVAGLPSRVAFRARNANGLPEEVKGTVLDAQNRKVAELNTLHDGMGAFEFTPVAGASYHAEVTGASGQRKSAMLPAVKEEGVTLSMNNQSPSRLFVQAERSEKNASAYDELLLLAQMNGQVVYTGTIKFSEDQKAAAIPKKNLPTGIIQVSLLSLSGTLLAERFAFIGKDSPGKALAQTQFDKGPRQKNSLGFDIAAYKSPSISLSIANPEAAGTDDSENLFSALYLTSDYTGYVHQPGWYFRDQEPSTLEALDLLLLTCPAGRFPWSDVLAGRFPALKYPVESGISVAGKLSKASGKDLKNGRLDFITKSEDSTTTLTTVKLTNSNEFYIPDLNFNRSATLFYQGTNTDRQNALVQVELYPAYFDTLRTSSYRPLIGFDVLSPDLMKKLLDEKARIDSANSHVLSTVIIKTRKPSVVDSLNRLYASDLYFNSDQTLAMDNGHYINVWQFLQRNVPGITVGKDQYGQTTVFFSRYMGLEVFASEENADSDATTNILFFLNEVPVSKDVIETLDPSDIGLVKVFKGTAASVLGASRGAIAFYTAKGRQVSDWRTKGLLSFRKEGYSTTRSFYNMDYALLDAETPFTDIRPTLYWSPRLQADKSGKLTVRFYNDDAARSFRIVVNGIDENGKIICEERTFE